MLKKDFIILGIAPILTGCTTEITQVGTSSSYDSPLYAGEPNINLKMITPIDGALETSDTGNEMGWQSWTQRWRRPGVRRSWMRCCRMALPGKAPV